MLVLSKATFLLEFISLKKASRSYVLSELNKMLALEFEEGLFELLYLSKKDKKESIPFLPLPNVNC